MKKTLALLAILAAPALYAASIEFEDGYGPYQVGQGGEFTFGETGLSLNGYVSGTTANVLGAGDQSFQSFCVSPVYVYAGVNYTVTPSDFTDEDNQLNAGIAWLYSQFATGGNFGGNATYYYGAGRTTSAAQLQDAIWALVGNSDLTSEVGLPVGYDSSNPFESAAVKEFGSWTAATAGVPIWSDGVSILLLNNDGDAQSQLYHVPDGGATMVLLGIALSGLAIYRRRV